MNIDSLKLNDEDKARVLEWYAAKYEQLLEDTGAFLSFSVSFSGSGKNNLLSIDTVNKTANSFLLDKEVNYNNITEIENLIDTMFVDYAKNLVLSIKKDFLRDLKVKNPELFL